MFINVITTVGVKIVTLAVVIAVVRAGAKLCLFFGVPSFLISVFKGLAVLFLDELGKSGFEIPNESKTNKALIRLA